MKVLKVFKILLLLPALATNRMRQKKKVFCCCSCFSTRKKKISNLYQTNSQRQRSKIFRGHVLLSGRLVNRCSEFLLAPPQLTVFSRQP